MAGLQILYHTLSHCHPEQLDWRNIWGCLFSFELWAVEAICRVRLATLKERTSPTRAARQQMKSHPHLSAELEAALSDTLLTCSTCSQNGVESSKIGWESSSTICPFFGSVRCNWFSLVFQVQHFKIHVDSSHLTLLRLLRPAQMDPRVRSCHGKAREGLKSKDAPVDPGSDAGFLTAWWVLWLSGSPDQPDREELNVMGTCGTCRRVARTFRSLA